MRQKSRCLLLVLLAVATFARAAPFAIPTPATLPHPACAAVPAANPAAYPDEAGFQRRAAIIRAGLVTVDLSAYRRGYFSGGDPGKYLPGHAMARLIENPDDADAIRYMNDARSPQEHYHFAAVNWARFYPLFGDRILSPATRAVFNQQAGRYSDYLAPRGTENHKVMSMTAANVLPWYTGAGLAHQNQSNTLARAKRNLRDYVKGLYAAGQGEWDSSTYLMFDLNGMLNVYDFSRDPECRLLAAAALDWYVAGYALKYTDGVYVAPNQRGFAGAAVKTIADQTGWLWWDSHDAPTPAETRDFRYTLAPMTSAWRPNRVLTRIAQRQTALPLPVEQRNTKPNYWYGPGLQPRAGQYQETVWITPSYTMGTLWQGHGSQISRFQIAASTPKGAVVFTGGHARRSDHMGRKTDVGYCDGNGRYAQMAQVGGLHVCLCNVPADDPLDYAFFAFPADAVAHERVGAWYVFEAGDTFVGVRGLGGEAGLGQTDLSDKDQAANAKAVAAGQPAPHAGLPIVRVQGRLCGFVVQTSDRRMTADRAAFAAALQALTIDDTKLAEDLTVICAALDGRTVRFRMRPDPDGDAHGDRRPDVWIDGVAVEPGTWPIYDGPLVRHANSILTVADGVEGYRVDFTGDLPVYRPLE